MFIAIKVYDRNGQLVESYSYEQLDLDPQLTAADFDPKNPAYGFF